MNGLSLTTRRRPVGAPVKNQYGTWKVGSDEDRRLIENARARVAKLRRAEQLAADPSLPLAHGKETTYNNWTCRCEPCRGAYSEAKARRRANRVPAARSLPDRSWAFLAACRGQGPALWFPADSTDAAAGLAVCEGCVVRSECASAGEGEYGTWGGNIEEKRLACVS